MRYAKSPFVLLLIAITLLFTLNFAYADFNNCWNKTGTSEAACTAVNGCLWRTSAQDSWCTDAAGCCMDINCGMYAGNQAACTNSSDSLNCTWDPYMMVWYPNGTQGPNGGCMMDWGTSGSSGGGTWGGVSEGCWSYDGNKAACNAKPSTCKWTQNNQNQDPWCYVKSLNDAKNKNPSATTTDIGCCQSLGCWNFDNNETACISAFQGNCRYANNTYGGGGWCSPKSCSDIIDEANCTYAKQNLMMPCNWTGSACSSNSYGSGGFGFYSNSSNSCFSAGGWFNSTGDCVMPSGNFSAGSGGFMFVSEAHCWFADNKPTICGNISGCAYCVTGEGPNGVLNASSNNICYIKTVGYCEGHATSEPNIYANANNSANLACNNIQVKSACEFGPLPNCVWSNSSVVLGDYCAAGAKTEKMSAPPAQYCEDPIAKNNYTICLQLINNFMMPCIWQNTTYPIKNCTFNGNAAFGSGEIDYKLINNQFACTSAPGGEWKTEYYVEGGLLKQDSWCEKSGLFNIDQGMGGANKGNCDTNCWACEFQANGSAWHNVTAAADACNASALGKCRWTTDSSAFNKLGKCEFPKEMETGGAKDCNIECEGCNFMNNPKVSCVASMALNGTGCKWVNDTNNINGGFCVDKTKKTCDSDCFSCFDFGSCTNSSISCTWDPTFNLCSPKGFQGEICFNGVDDDSDGLIDCNDPDCGFDNFCGGSSFGGNCFAKTTKATCNATLAFGALNCTWINDTWNPTGWCDMPGANCWKFGEDLNLCGLTPGCTNQSTSMGGGSFCEMNNTKMDGSSCWQYSSYATCAGNCVWRNNTWVGAAPGSGWCEYAPTAACSVLNSTSCNLNSNCTWKQDNYSMSGGWCDIACFNPNSNQASCENDSLNGLCRWKNMNATCQPSTFMVMGMQTSGGGKKGCWQYDGNQTSCLVNSITCTYKNDTNARNNKSDSEPSGWCMDKAEFEQFGSMEGNVIQLAMDGDNVMGAAETGVSAWVDIMGVGMRVNDEGFNFGAGIFNMTPSMLCNGYMIGSGFGPMQTPIMGTGNQTTKFYWYLDTNGNSSDGCNATTSTGANITGYDLLISYTSRNESTGLVETKQLMKCSSGVWTPTNTLVTTSKKLSCGEVGGVMIAVSKQGMESFAEYNQTAIMKIFMVSANESDSRTDPSDSAGPGYYTPGTIDFGFVDCSNPDNTNDPKCKNFQKFGFNVFEECKNGVDDDENGLADCNDPFCTFTPACAGTNAFAFGVDVNDKAAPVVMYTEVEKLYDAAFLRVDTNEPSNLSLEFYTNDSTCKTLNMSLNDSGTGYQANANFKPFHTVDLVRDNLGYALRNGTIYYYKIKVCDTSNNCALSACANFTTKAAAEDKPFIFKIDLPDGYSVDIPALNKTNYNFTESFGGTVYDVGIKTNTSVTRNINFTIHCSDMAIGFFGVNILSPTKIDLSNAFICNTTRDIMGMNSTLKKWNKLINDLHLGGAADYIEITIPVAYAASNVFNWTDDTGSSGENVTSYVSCRDGGSSNTICKVPVSMGFSAYTVSVPAAASGTVTPGGGGGGGSGNSKSYTISSLQFTNGYTQALAAGDSVNFAIGSKTHTLVVNSIGTSNANITLRSTPVNFLIAIGEIKKAALDSLSYYEVSVKLNSLSTTKANVTIKSISELIPSGQSVTGDVVSQGNVSDGGTSGDTGAQGSTEGFFKPWMYIVIALIIVGLLYLIYRYYSNSKILKLK